jgi:hypothetical protein
LSVRVGVFDWFRKGGSKPAISREVLFEAANADDLERFAALCSEHAHWTAAKAIARVRGNRAASIGWLHDAVQAAEAARLSERAESLRSRLEGASTEPN